MQSRPRQQFNLNHVVFPAGMNPFLPVVAFRNLYPFSQALSLDEFDQYFRFLELGLFGWDVQAAFNNFYWTAHDRAVENMNRQARLEQVHLFSSSGAVSDGTAALLKRESGTWERSSTAKT